LQSMLSYGRYQTFQISSNISYVSRIYGQNFLAYSSIDDLLIFIEPKHQIHVYNGRTIQHIVNLSTTDVVIATSCASLLSNSHHELFFIYETNSETNLISLRVCQVLFNKSKLIFENNLCIETIKIQYDQPNLLVNGFTIKRDHAGTKKSLLFISTYVGIIYAIFDTHTGSLFGQTTIMNETLNEGSIALSSSGSIYYASKQEHLIYELKIARDFRLYYGKIIKANAIKHPFGLITDECNHLYIATRSMVLIMFVQTYTTIRSVFSKASDLPITLERLNATTYVYATIKKSAKNLLSYWMFNFLYFTEPEKIYTSTRHSAVNWKENLDFNNAINENASSPILWPISYVLSSTANTTKKYTQFFSTPRKPFSRFTTIIPKYEQKNNSIDQEISSINKTKLLTGNSSTVSYIPFESDDSQLSEPDENDQFIENTQFNSQEPKEQSSEKKFQSDTPLVQKTSSDPHLLPSSTPESVIYNDNLPSVIEKGENLSTNAITQSQDYKSTQPPSDLKYFNSTTHPEEILFSDDDLQSFLEGRTNLSKNQKAQIEAYLSKQSSSTRSTSSKYLTSTKLPATDYTSNDNMYFDNESEDKQFQDYDSKIPLSDSEIFNDTIDKERILFTDDDLRSFLEGRANLSKTQKAQIQAYLNKQASFNRSTFSKYLTSTKVPRRKYTSHDNVYPDYQSEDTQFQGYLTKIPSSDSKDFNRTTYREGVLFSDNDLRSFLEGRANLSKNQIAQIRVYLNKKSSLDQGIFATYSTSTKLPERKYTPGDNVQPDYQSENTQSQSYATKTPLSDSKDFNGTIDTEEIVFSDDDLQSFLEGRANFSKNQQAQIEAYLRKQSSSNQSTISKYLMSTKLPARKYASDDHRSFDHEGEDTDSYSYLATTPLSESKDFNRTTDREKILFTDDDLRTYLEGQANLSKSQKVQIETYLNKQRTSNRGIFSRYLTSTKLPTRKYTADDNAYADYENEDRQSQDYDSKIPLSDSKDVNRPIDQDEILFSDDDLRSFLEGRANLSKNQIAQIKDYLSKQSSSTPDIFSRYLTSTKQPTRKYISDDEIYSDHENEDTQLQDYHSTILLSNSTDFIRTMDTEGILFSDNDLRSFLESRANLSKNQKAQIEAYLNKQASFNRSTSSKYLTSTKVPRRKYTPDDNVYLDYENEDTQLQDYDSNIPLSNFTDFNRTIDTEGIVFSDDDLRSFLEDRANLSKNQIAQIRAYLSKQSSPSQGIFARYSTSTKLPTRKYAPDGNIYLDYQSEGTQSQSYVTKAPLSDSRDFNGTIDTEEILFSNDDLRSFLEGRANLSKIEIAQIEAYLNKQSSSNQGVFSKHSTSTKLPTETYTSGDVYSDYQSENTQSQRYLTTTPLSNSTFFNHTIDKEEILFSNDDLRSFLEGRANLSKNQKAQIQAYLNKQSSSNQSTISKYLTSTKLPAGKYTPDDEVYSDYQSEDTQLPEYASKIPLSDSKDLNRTIGQDRILFSDDDLRSFLEDRANLSKNQKAQIEAYLSKQTSPDQGIFARYSTSTKLPSIKYTSDDNVHPDYQIENTQSQSYATKAPLLDSKDFNRTTDQEEILFSSDDLRSFLEGRANLSKNQKAQIEAYLSKQSSPDQGILSRYSTTIKVPGRKYTPDDNVYSDYESKDTQPQDYHLKIPLSDSKDLNRTVDQDSILFSDDDLRSFLEDRANLSKNQKAQIEAYLSKQTSLDQGIFARYSTSTKLPSIKYTPDDNVHPDYQIQNTQSQSYGTKVPLFDSKDFNRTTDQEEILFSNDDLRSFLEGRANLSKNQKAQIEAYLSKQSSPDQGIFSRYSTTTKVPGRKYTPDDNVYSGYESKDTQPQDYHLKIPLSDSKDLNRTTDQEGILFSDDDLRSFLEGRVNLSQKQKTQIEAHLNKQSSFDQRIFSTYSTSTNQPAKIYTPDDSIFSSYGTENTQSQSYLTKSPIFDSKDVNTFVDLEEIFVSADDLQSYLQGRSNLSLAQEAQIEAYLAKQTSLNRSTFLKYFTTKSTPTKISLPGDKLEVYSKGQTNLSLSEPIQSSEVALQNVTSTIAFTTKKPTSIRRPWQSIINGSNDVDDNIEQPSDIYADSTDNKNVSIDILNEISQWSSSTSLISPLQTDTSLKSTKQPPHSKTSINTPLKEALVTIPSDTTKSDFIFNEKSRTDNPIHRLSAVSSLDQRTQDTSNVSLISSTLSINDSSTLKYHSLVTQLNPNLMNENVTQHFNNYNQPTSIHDDDDKVNFSLFSMKFKSTMDPKFLQTTPRQLISTNVQSISADINVDQTSSDLIAISADNITNISSLSLVTHQSNTQITVNQTQTSSPQIHDIIIPSMFQNLSVLHNRSNINDTSKPYNTVEVNLNDESINIKQTSTSPTLITNDTSILITTSDHIHQNIKDKINHKHSSAMSVDVNVTSTSHPPSSLIVSNTTLLPSRRSPLSSILHYSSHPYSSTKSPKFTSFSSRKLFSDTTITTTTTTTPTTIATTTTTTSIATATTTTSIATTTLITSIATTTLITSIATTTLTTSIATTTLTTTTITTPTTMLLSSEITTMPSYSTIFSSSTSTLQSSHEFSSIQTTNEARTSHIKQSKLITTLADMSSSPPVTTYQPHWTSTITSTLFLTTNEQLLTTTVDSYTSKLPEIYIESSSSSSSSLSYVKSTETFTTNYQSITTTLVPTTNLDSSPTITSDKTSIDSTLTTTNEENLSLSNYQPLETTETLHLSSLITDQYQEEFTSLKFASTIVPHVYKSKIFSTLEHSTLRTSYPSTSSIATTTITSTTTSTTTTTKTTIHRYRTRKSKTTSWKTQPLSTSSSSPATSTIPSYRTTINTDYKLRTSTQISTWPSEWNFPKQQETIRIKPSLIKNNSNTLLSNDLLNEIFNNLSTSTNSSTEKYIYFNLNNYPPSSWNLSLNSNDNIVLDVILPISTSSTNLTFTNIEAKRVVTNIIGKPINLQVDRVQTKQFSLVMNATDNSLNSNRTRSYISDVIIGHVKSEQFELNLTKTDNMHVRVRQVDAATAELYLDSNFCTNESSLEINLNLSQNGTIRYGNRKPIHIGPVFTRVHMLKQSCDREQPLALFFDICERTNPCLNHGICQSIMPDYNDKSYSNTDTGHVGYKCECPLHTSGEHCQYLQYPLGYCLNSGTLFETNDIYNNTIEKCICTKGFRGEHCEENIDNCIGITCSNHGICEDGIDQYKCSCFDGYYGFNCERKYVQIVLLQAASRSFGIVAILLIATIAALVVASDIHTYVTRKHQTYRLPHRIPRVKSEVFENSVLLLGFSDAPIEMNDLSTVRQWKKPIILKQRQTNRTTRFRKTTGYQQLSRRKQLTIIPKSSSSSSYRRYAASNRLNQTIL
ncbi:unnamed protein product, partial [Rotaria sordida]